MKPRLLLPLIAIALFVTELALAQPKLPPDPPQAGTNQPFAGGSGTQADPYLVATAAQLDSVRHYVNSYFKQTVDINLNVAPYNSGSGWLPIQHFTGSYDGGGHTISGLMINRPDSNNVGLFGTVNGTSTSALVIQKLALSAPVVTGNNQVGALVGDLSFGRVEQVGIKGGTVTVKGNNGGGIVGALGTGTGGSTTSTARIDNNYSTARVIGPDLNGSGYGGLVGLHRERATMRGNLAAGVVSGPAGSIGGLVGHMLKDLSSPLNDNFYLRNSNERDIGSRKAGIQNRSIGVGLTTNQMYQQASYTNANGEDRLGFNGPWIMLDEGSVLPELRVFVTDFSVMYAGGSGTQADPYQIATAKQLYHVRQLPAAYFQQTADINLGVAPYDTTNNAPGWTPIEQFNGSFNGNGYTISNLLVNPAVNPSGVVNNLGLFAIVGTNAITATLENMTLINPFITNGDNVGALAGSIGGVRLTNVHIRGGSVVGSGSVGGLAGVGGSILNNGMVRIIMKSSAIGMRVTNTSSQAGTSSGGLFGTVYFAEIIDSYVANKVQGGSVSGGLAGALTGLPSRAITNSYSASAVNGSGSAKVGGLFAEIAGVFPSVFVPITNSYYNSDSTASSNAYGTALTTAQMRQRASFTNWDFTNTWVILNGFPELRAFVDFSTFFAGGSGTQSDPYQIATADQLYNVRLIPTAHYLQTADINLNTTPYNTGQGWLPIQDFTGSYDGGGFTISNLFINQAASDTVGLFARVTGATLTNLALSNPSVTGKNVVGALAGAVNSATSTVSRVQVTGGSVSGTERLGGLAGVSEGPISLSAATRMSVSGSGYLIGGLIGQTKGTGSSISNSYAINKMSSSASGSAPGGLVGFGSSSTITNSYTAGSGVRGIVSSNGGGTITNSYFNSDSSAASTNGTPLTTAQMRQRASFPGWDFDTTWYIEEGVDFPGLLFSFGINGVFAGGSGTAADPFQVATPDQVNNIRRAPGAHYRQTIDIDMWVRPYRRSPYWTPIPRFTGSYDGGGHTLSNLRVYDTNYSFRTGLFELIDAGGSVKDLHLAGFSVNGGNFAGILAGSVLNNSTVTRVRISNSDVSGETLAGGLAGELSGSTISESSVSGSTVQSNTDTGGGLVGHQGGSIHASYTTGGYVGGSAWAGGLVGSSVGTITDSYSTGMRIFSYQESGGLVGVLYGSGASITNTYSINHVNGNNTGGLVGEADNAAITTSYSASVATGSNPAGLVSNTHGNVVITHSYYNSDSTSAATAYGTGLTTAQMRQQASFTGWDFTRNWVINEGVAFPDLHIGIHAKASSSHFAETVPGSEVDADQPTEVGLQQNYPNPFNPVTTINYQVPEQSRVRLEVFDMLGRRVATLVDNQQKQAGRYSVRFDARHLTSGMYLYRLQAGNTIITKKLTLIK